MCDGVGGSRLFRQRQWRRGVYMVAAVVVVWIGRAERGRGLVWQAREVRLV